MKNIREEIKKCNSIGEMMDVLIGALEELEDAIRCAR